MTLITKYLLIFLLLSVIFISGCVTDCGNDLECFKESAKNCSKSKVNVADQDGNNIRVTIRGANEDSCKISFKIESLGENFKSIYPQESKIAVGKTLNCEINKKYFDLKKFDYISEIFNLPDEFDKSCSGPIKELLEGPLKPVIVNEFRKIII